MFFCSTHSSAVQSSESTFGWVKSLRGGGQSRDKGKLLEPLQTSPWKRNPFQPQDIFRICGFASLS